ncbi:MAG: NosD domain-containing protein [Candidatus Hodarchaeota archaeon]
MNNIKFLIIYSTLILTLSSIPRTSCQESNQELNLIKIGEVPTGGDAYDVWIDENKELAYVTCGYDGLWIINVNDPSNPIQMAHIPESPAVINTGHSTGYAHQLYVDNNFVYVGDGAAGLTIANISDPRNPLVATRYTEGYAWDIHVVEKVAYVTNGFLGNTAGLAILNVTNPTKPSLLGNYTIQSDITCIEVQKDLAFLADSDNGLVIVDISNNSAPFLKGECTGPENGGVGYVEVVNDLAYLTAWNKGLKIVNVSDPTEISTVNEYSLDVGYFSIKVFGNNAYLGGLYEGLVILNVSDSSNPVEIGHYREKGRVDSAYAILLVESHNNTIGESIISIDVENGIYLQDSHENNLTDNQVKSIKNGVVLSKSNSNILSKNDISDNKYGIILKGC